MTVDPSPHFVFLPLGGLLARCLVLGSSFGISILILGRPFSSNETWIGASWWSRPHSASGRRAGRWLRTTPRDAAQRAASYPAAPHRGSRNPKQQAPISRSNTFLPLYRFTQ